MDTKCYHSKRRNFLLKKMKKTFALLSICLLLSSGVHCRELLTENVPESTYRWTEGDTYVSHFASVLEIMIARSFGDIQIATSESSGAHHGIFLRRSLDISKKLAIERIKISFSEKLRKSFQDQHTEEIHRINNDPRVLPYFVETEIASILVHEGYHVPLSKFWKQKNANSNSNIPNKALEAESETPRRALFDFPIKCSGCSGCTWAGCSGCSGCETAFTCWGISKVIEGLSMDETCDLLENFQNLGGDVSIDDILREIPLIIETVGKIESILGFLTLPFCQGLIDVLDGYKEKGDESVFYYPKAMCGPHQMTTVGCISEVFALLRTTLDKPLVTVLPTSTEETLRVIAGLIGGIGKEVPHLCRNLDLLGVFDNDSVLSFVDKWEDVFSQVNDLKGNKKTKIEVVLDILDNLQKIDFAKQYIPAIPYGCKPVIAQAAASIYTDIIQIENDPDTMASSLCRVLDSNGVHSCFEDFSKNINQVEWISDLIGNDVINKVVVELIPPLCKSVRDSQGLSSGAILQHLPDMITLLKMLDSDLGISLFGAKLQGILTDCNDELAGIATEVVITLSSGGEKEYLKLLCESLAGNECLIKLSDELDELSFVYDEIGKGTLKVLISQSIPDACEITHNVLDENGKIDADRLLLKIPDFISWYKSLSTIPQLSSLLPAFPEQKCSDKVIRHVVAMIKNVTNSADYPLVLCRGIDSSVKICLNEIGSNLEETSWIKEAFSSNVASVGPKETFGTLTGQLIPAMCGALDTLNGGFETEDLIANIPIFVNAYQQLDVIALEKVYPMLDQLLKSSCNMRLGKLVTAIGQALKSDDVFKSMLSIACTGVSNNQCLVKLSKALDEMPFVTENIGIGALEHLVEDAIPSTCSFIAATADSFEVQNLLQNVGGLFDMLDRLRYNDLLGKYVPSPPEGKCRKKIQVLISEVSEKYSEYPMDLPNAVCHDWVSDGTLQCVGNFGDSLVRVDFIRIALKGKNKDFNQNFIRSFIETDIPLACELIEGLISTEKNVSLTDHIFESVPTLLYWFKDLHVKLPGFALDMIPEFPTEICDDEILQKITQRFLNTARKDADVLKTICGGEFLDLESRNCLIAVGENIAQSQFLSETIGLPEGFIRTLVEEDLFLVCSFILNKEGEFSVTNLLGKFPEIIQFVSTLREKLPESIKSYIPMMPTDCEAEYKNIGESLGASNFDQIPGEFCKLGTGDFECLAKLGDAVDEIEGISKILGGKGLIRTTVSILENTACDIFKELSDLNLDDLPLHIEKALKALDRLNAYTILDNFIPDIPQSCEVELIETHKALSIGSENNTGYLELICTFSSESQSCISELGRNLQNVHWVSQQFPDTGGITDDVLELVPSICLLLHGKIDVDEVLIKLPVVISLLEKLQDVEVLKSYLPDVSSNCLQEYNFLAESIAHSGLNGLPTVLCSIDERAKVCFVDTASQIDVFPNGLMEEIIFNALPKACSLMKKLGTEINYQSIVTSLPDIMHFIQELNEIDIIAQYVPNVNEKCVETLGADLTIRLQQISQESNSNAMSTSKIPEAICGITKEEEHCVMLIARDALSIPLVYDFAKSKIGISDYGIMTLVEEAFDLLPSACLLLDGILGNSVVSKQDVLGTFPNILDSLEKLRSYTIFRPYIPVFEYQCFEKLQDFFLYGEEDQVPSWESNEGVNVPALVCKLTKDSSLSDCFRSISRSIDETDFFHKSLQRIDPRLTMESLINVLLIVAPKVCTVLFDIFDATGRKIIFEHVFRNIPVVIEVYVEVTNTLDLNNPILPVFPSKLCPVSIQNKMSHHLNVVAENPATAINILCISMSREEKECIGALADSIGETMYLRDALGRPGLLNEIFGDPLGGICSLISDDIHTMETDIAISNILSHVDLLLELIISLRKVSPDFFGPFLPSIPELCQQELDDVGKTVGGIVEEFSSNAIATMCSFSPKQYKCLQTLGDSIEETDIFRDALWGNDSGNYKTGLLHEVITVLNGTICSLIDKLGQISFEIEDVVAMIPDILRLLDTMSSYPYLELYVPKIPSGCVPSFEDLAEKVGMVKDRNEQSQVLCTIGQEYSTRKCLLDLGHHLETISFISTSIPDSASILEEGLDLLRPVCDILIGCEADSQRCSIEENNVISHLPAIVSLVTKIDKVIATYTGNQALSEGCHDILVQFSIDIIFPGDTSIDINRILCSLSFSEGSCLKQLGNNLQALPVFKSVLPVGILSFFVDVILNGDVCSLLQSVKTMNYQGFAVAIPLLMQTLEKLEHVSFLQGYIPVISANCKHIFSTTITSKVSLALGLSSDNLAISAGNLLSTGLDLSPLTNLLCEFSEAETTCFSETGRAIAGTPEIASLIKTSLMNENTGKEYPLDVLIETALETRNDACEIFDHIGKFEFDNIIDIAPQILRLLHNLNSFPVINAYVPDISTSCVTILSRKSMAMSGLSDLCPLDKNTSWCLNSLARELDQVSEISSVFKILSQDPKASIQGVVRNITLDILPSTCLLLEDIGISLRGMQISRLFRLFPDIIASLKRLQSLPFVGDLVPNLSNKCENTLTDFGEIVEAQRGHASGNEELETETTGLLMVCNADKKTKQCFLELDKSLHESPIIGKSIPVGIVGPFLELSETAGSCDFLNKNDKTNMTRFLINNMPVFVKVSLGLVNLDQGCEQNIEQIFQVSNSEATHSLNVDAMCAVGEDCRNGFLSQLAKLPLIGSYVPLELTITVNDFCSVKAGLKSMSDFISTHLETLVTLAAQFSNMGTKCSAVLDELSATIRNGHFTPLSFCSLLGSSRCLRPFVSQFGQLPLGDETIPKGLADLIEETCEFISPENSQQRNIFSLLPHLPVLVEVLGLNLGFPNDQCANEFVLAGEKMLKMSLNKSQAEFKILAFCSQVRYECMHEFVSGLQKLPLVGEYLPSGTEELIAESCVVIDNKDDFGILESHLPIMFDLIQKLLLDLDIENTCRDKVTTLLFDRYGNFVPEYVCAVGSKCSQNLIDSLKKIPILGEFVPNVTAVLFEDLCRLSRQVSTKDGKMKKADMESLLPEIINTVGILTQSSNPKCGMEFMNFYKTSDGKLNIQHLCEKVNSEECRNLLASKLERTPLIGKFVPVRTGELLSTSCAVLQKETPRAIVENNLANILSVAGGMIEFQTRSCSKSMIDLSSVYKTQSDICVDKFCEIIPSDCIRELENGLADIPFMGKYLPVPVHDLVKFACEDTQSSLTKFHSVVPRLMHRVSKFSDTEDSSCSNRLENFANSLLNSNFDADEMCSKLKPECVDDFANQLLSLPFIGCLIPRDIKTVLKNSCRMVDLAENKNNYENGFFDEVFPAVMEVASSMVSSEEGRTRLLEHDLINTSCTHQIESFALKTGRKAHVDVKKLCTLDRQCLELLIHSLDLIPLIGEIIPPTTADIVFSTCEIFDEGEKILTDETLLMKTATTINLMNKVDANKLGTNPCVSKLKQLLEEIYQVQQESSKTEALELICTTLTQECIADFISGYQSISFFNEIMGSSYDALLNSGCELFSTGLLNSPELAVKQILQPNGIFDNSLSYIYDYMLSPSQCQTLIDLINPGDERPISSSSAL